MKIRQVIYKFGRLRCRKQVSLFSMKQDQGLTF